MKQFLILMAFFLASCTAAQKDWRNNLYFDISAGGDQEYKSTVTSAGVSYPLVWDVWATVGVWNDFYGTVGPYWGLSYAWAPFAKEEKHGPPVRTPDNIPTKTLSR